MEIEKKKDIIIAILSIGLLISLLINFLLSFQHSVIPIVNPEKQTIVIGVDHVIGPFDPIGAYDDITISILDQIVER